MSSLVRLTNCARADFKQNPHEITEDFYFFFIRLVENVFVVTHNQNICDYYFPMVCCNFLNSYTSMLLSELLYSHFILTPAKGAFVSFFKKVTHLSRCCLLIYLLISFLPTLFTAAPENIKYIASLFLTSTNRLHQILFYDNKHLF